MMIVIIILGNNIAKSQWQSSSYQSFNNPTSSYLNTMSWSRISKNITDQVQAERIELDVYNNNNQLSPGMFAELFINLRGTPNALSVPKSAVVTSTEKIIL